MAELSPPETKTSQPAVVNIAVTLLYWSMAFSIAWLLVSILFLGKFRMPGFLFGIAFGYGSVVWLIDKIDQGRNWARITLLIFFIVGVLLVIPAILKLFSHRSYVLASFSIARIDVEAVVYIMLFSRAAAPWFRRVESSEEGPPARASDDFR